MNSPISVAILNKSTAVTDKEIQSIIPALQTQVSRDLAPAWNVDAKISLVAAGNNAPAGSYRIFIEDRTNSPTQDTGYHSADYEGPLARVFVLTARDAKQNWTIVLSHELLEMLVNPYGNLAAFVSWNDTEITGFPDSSGLTGIYYDLEICDPVYPDENAYKIGDVSVSDFVLPQWFTPWIVPPDSTKPPRPVDQANKIDGPEKLAQGAQLAASSTGRYLVRGPEPTQAAVALRTPSGFLTAKLRTTG